MISSLSALILLSCTEYLGNHDTTRVSVTDTGEAYQVELYAWPVTDLGRKYGPAYRELPSPYTKDSVRFEIPKQTCQAGVDATRPELDCKGMPGKLRFDFHYGAGTDASAELSVRGFKIARVASVDVGNEGAAPGFELTLSVEEQTLRVQMTDVGCGLAPWPNLEY